MKMRGTLAALMSAAAALIAVAGIASDRAPAAPGPDVRIDKTGPAVVSIRQAFTYELRVWNAGEANKANGVRVTDVLPAGLTFSRASSPCTLKQSSTVECNLGKLDAGEERRLSIDVVASQAGAVENVAKVVFDDDKTASDSVTTRVTTAPSVALAGATSANEGDTKTFSFNVSDPDPGDTFTVPSSYPRCGANGVLVALQLSAGGGSFACRFPDGDASSFVAIRVDDSAGVTSNVATLAVVVANVAPDVQLSGASTASDGETKTYAFAVADPGSDVITIEPGYPRCGANGTFVTGSLQAASSGGTFQCRFSAPGQTASSVVAIRVRDSDGAASGEDAITVTVASAPPPPDTRADLALTKTASTGTLPVGSTLTYTLTVTNNGPATAAGVRVVDPMPSGLTATTITTTQGTCTGSGAIACSLGSLDSAARATIRISVQPTAAGSLVNTAIVAATTSDPVSANDAATVETTVTAPATTTTAPTTTPATTTTTTTTTTTIAAGSTTVVAGTSTVATPAAPDVQPPHEVGRLHLRRAATSLRLTWRLPTDADLAGVVVTRTTSGSPKALTLLRGRVTALTDRRVRAGARYSYRVRTYDTVGNTSRGIVAAGTALTLPLFAPPPNAHVASPPLLQWRPAKGASYYNVQLFRNGQKLLSAWPRSPMLRLRSSWRFERRTYELSPGTYRWYVWPGFGDRSLTRYGALLGQSAFIVARGAS